MRFFSIPVFFVSLLIISTTFALYTNNHQEVDPFLTNDENSDLGPRQARVYDALRGGTYGVAKRFDSRQIQDPNIDSLPAFFYRTHINKINPNNSQSSQSSNVGQPLQEGIEISFKAIENQKGNSILPTLANMAIAPRPNRGVDSLSGLTYGQAKRFTQHNVNTGQNRAESPLPSELLKKIASWKYSNVENRSDKNNLHRKLLSDRNILLNLLLEREMNMY